MSVVHGGNIYELSARAGCSPDEILDFSASINPLGPPPGLARILSGCFRMLESYPDIYNQLLTDAISKFHDIAPECIAVANGSTELIYWLPRALESEQRAGRIARLRRIRESFRATGNAPAKTVCGRGKQLSAQSRATGGRTAQRPMPSCFAHTPGKSLRRRFWTAR